MNDISCVSSFFCEEVRMLKKLISFVIAISVFLTALSQTTGVYADDKRIPVIIDTDIGNSTDDLFALEIAYKLMDMGVVDLKGIVVDRMGEGYADLADIENTYYGHQNIPIGVERNGINNSIIHIDYRMLDELKNADGSKMFKRTDTNMKDNLDGYKLYRKLLSEAEDGSVRIVLIGFVSSIVQLLESQPDEYSPLTGAELVKKKVHSAYFMATKLGLNTDAGYNLEFDIPLARRFVTEWPSDVDMYISPSQLGRTIEYKPEQILADLSYTDANPIKQTYLNKNCNTGQKMWDHLCMINAVYPGCFEFSPKGRIAIAEDGSVSFFENPNEAFRYQLMENKGWSDKHLEYLRYYTILH